MPYENEHSCRIHPPDKYDKFNRVNCDQKHDGKCIDVIYGIKEGKSEIQALRYKTDTWTEEDAREHCKSREGTFEPADENKSLKDQYMQLRQKGSIEDYEYLLHHVEIDENDEEIIHHCYVYDHIGNLFEQGHLIVRDGKIFINGKKAKDGIYHVIIGLESKQNVCWSDEEAEKNGIKPKKMKAGMTYKQKSKEW